MPEASGAGSSTPSLSCGAGPAPLGLSFPSLGRTALQPCSGLRDSTAYFGDARSLRHLPSTLPLLGCGPGVQGGPGRPREGQEASETLNREAGPRDNEDPPAPTSARPRAPLASPAYCVTPGSSLTLSGPIWSWATNCNGLPGSLPRQSPALVSPSMSGTLGAQAWVGGRVIVAP